MSLTKTFGAGISGFVIGAFVILGIRFVTYKPVTVHYHANFAVYLNGQPEKFGSPLYYLDGSCSMSGIMTPESRAHLAKGYDGVVHVQDHSVTWGQFFENLGWYVGDDFIKTADSTLYQASGQSRLHIIIDGQDYTDLGGITNRVIEDKDRLLLSYGDETQQTITQQYNSVPNTAGRYDGMRNSSSCGHSINITTKDRLAHLF